MDETKKDGPIEADDARELIAGSPEVKVVDIRGAEAREEGYVPGSMTAEEDELEEIISENEGTVVLVCQDGERSGELAEKLSGEGADVRSIKGGMEAWNAEKAPIQPRDDFNFKGPGGAPGT